MSFCLKDDIDYWTEKMRSARDDRLAAVCFGIATGLKMAQKEYGLSVETICERTSTNASDRT